MYGPSILKSKIVKGQQRAGSTETLSTVLDSLENSSDGEYKNNYNMQKVYDKNFNTKKNTLRQFPASYNVYSNSQTMNYLPSNTIYESFPVIQNNYLNYSNGMSSNYTQINSPYKNKSPYYDNSFTFYKGKHNEQDNYAFFKSSIQLAKQSFSINTRNYSQNCKFLVSNVNYKENPNNNSNIGALKQIKSTYKERQNEYSKESIIKVHRSIRAIPPDLGKRKILAKPLKTIGAEKVFSYKVNMQDGIQVPAVRIHKTPLSLSNWTSSWQEMFCYNPRRYDITEDFLDNYTVIRGIFEDNIKKITDIIFLNKCGNKFEPFIANAYLLPPVYPHKYSIATSLQCYTSDDEWLTKGAWDRSVKYESKNGIIFNKMRPTNEKHSPFFPFYSRDSASKKDTKNEPMINYLLEKDSLPLHLWVILGGKDMMALDGISIAWKFLRWACEIPPSEFLEFDESNLNFEKTSSTPSWWKSQSPSEIYQLYHKKPNKSNSMKPTQNTTNQDNSQKFNYYGPWLYNIENIPIEKQYKCSFLFIDYPGYGNSSGSPNPYTIRSTILKALKETLQELSEYYDINNVIINIFGYSLGCSVALNLLSDLAQSIINDSKLIKKRNKIHKSRDNLNKIESTECSTLYDSDTNFSLDSINFFDKKSASMNSMFSTPQCSSDENEDDIKINNIEDLSFLTIKDLGEIYKEDHNLIFHQKNINNNNKNANGEIKKANEIAFTVNRLILIAPFSTTQEMAKRITQDKIGSMLSKAISCFISQSIHWDNLKVAKKLFEDLSYIQKKLKIDTFKNLKIYIQHGEKDNLIPWTMSRDLTREMITARTLYNMKIPIQLLLLPNRDHVSVMMGMAELQMIETCFAPYRLHPCSPLSTLKYYKKKLNLHPIEKF